MTRIWAHRGASADAPENTMPAFRLAVEQGADGIELDVQRSSDGVLVVCHDETVERTSDGHGAVVDSSYARLREFDFGNGRNGFAGVGIPTLAEVLELVADTGVELNIELKNSVERYPGMEAEVVELVERRGVADRVWYSSFNHLSLAQLAGLGASSPRGVLYTEWLVEPWRYAAGFGASALHPMGTSVDAEVIERSHAAGLRVHV